jgi:UDP-glucuronate 4-epimerase
MRILITGGAGFIGSRLSKHLLEIGSEVVVIDNLNDYYDPAIKKSNIQILSSFDSFSFYQGDIRSVQDMIISSPITK